MRVTRQYFLAAVVLSVVATGAYFGLRGKSDQAAKTPRNPVQVIKSGVALQKDIPVTIYANGYVTALRTVEVRPQVQNIVRSIHVTEGQDVRAGQLLFTLDLRSDTSNVDKARAQLGRDRADLMEAENALKRNQELASKNFVSQAVVDTARSKVDGLRSTIEADQASVQSNSILLGNNRISASISGRIGAINVHPGSLAQPAGTPMLTISQIDPITVSFSVPERELTRILATYPDGDAPVIAQLPGKQEVEGRLSFIDSASDTQSGTIKMKARFANGQRKLWPGTFVNVRLVAQTITNAVVIPAQAIVTGPVDKSVYVVQADDTVKPQKIEVLALDDGQAAVSGLTAGARVVVEGAQNLRPGSKVKETAPASGGKSARDGNKSPAGQ